MAVSGVLSLILFIVFKAEAAKGRRIFLSTFRHYLDQQISKRGNSWALWKKYFGASSFRLFLHYLLHQGLGATLFVISFIENKLHDLRRKNKNIAKVVVGSDRDNHLHHIAMHKKSTALSEKEKEGLKERSMND